MQVKELNILDFVGRLKEQRGFSFARYGDGTFMSLNGDIGLNCDGAKVGPEQEEELEKSIRDDTITHGIGDLALSVGRAEEWLSRKGIDIEWYDANVMNTASHTGKLFPFVEWLRKRRTVILGPSHLNKLKAFPVVRFIEVHPTLAFDQLDELQLIAQFSIERDGADTVLISIGPGAPALVSRIHRDIPYLNVIDTGSIWDPYVGIYSRKIHRRMGRRQIEKLGVLNFKQNISHWGK